MLLNHVEGDIKLFVKSTDCRRKAILEHFDKDNERPLLKHLCCDNCANNCDCGLPDCKTSLQYPVSVDAKSSRSSSRTRDIQPLQREHVKRCLIKYHKSLVVDCRHGCKSKSQDIDQHSIYARIWRSSNFTGS